MSLAHAVVLGHSGFIGSELVETLRPQFEVRGFSSRQADLSRTAGLSALSRALRPDTVLFVALRATSKKSERKRGDSLESLQAYVRMISNLTGLLARRPIRKCVYLSSASVYDDSATDMKISETRLVNPQSWYGISKSIGEMLMRKAAKAYRFPLVIARPCNVFGPAGFVAEAVKYGGVSVYGDGSELRDQLYVRDLARALRGLSRGRAQGDFNLATGRSVPIRAVLDSMGLPLRIKSLKRTRPKVDLGYSNLRLKRALTGFRFTPLRKAMRESIETLGGNSV